MNPEREKALGEVLRRFRRSTGLSQEAFGARARLDRTYISSVERGHRNPTIASVRKWIVAANVSWEEFGRQLDKLDQR